MQVMGEPEDTPLQEKLGWLATAIGKVGLVVAVVSFVVLMIRSAWSAHCCVAVLGWMRAIPWPVTADQPLGALA